MERATKDVGQGGVRELARPIVIGFVLTGGFYALLHAGVFRSEFLLRYLAGHPVEYAEVAMVMVGMAAVLLRGVHVLRQGTVVPRVALAAPSHEGHDSEHATRLLGSLQQLPAEARNSYLVRRWSDALEHVRRKDSADQLDEELKYLADMDAVRMHEGYSLVRIIIWATPMLGFLGTVMGITLALGDLSPEALVNSPKDAMEGLLGGLSIAFDTTALALTLSIALMFAQFLVSQLETHLLAWVDRRTNEELVGRFRQLGTGRDPTVATVKRMALSVVEASERLVEQQVTIWSDSQQQTEQRMANWWRQARDELAHASNTELQRSVVSYVEGLRGLEEARSAEMRAWQEQLRQVTLVAAERFERQQSALDRQCEQFQQLADRLQNRFGPKLEVPRRKGSTGQAA